MSEDARLWDNAAVIYAYTRAQAIDDAVLVGVSASPRPTIRTMLQSPQK